MLYAFKVYKFLKLKLTLDIYRGLKASVRNGLYSNTFKCAY